MRLPTAWTTVLVTGLLVPTCLVATCLAVTANDARAQFTAPCEVSCALALGASSFAFAMGTTAAVGRLKGGYATRTGPSVTFATAFLASAGTGLALRGDGDRQRRVIYGSALGAAGGAVVGLTMESLVGKNTTATRWAATLVGASVGVLAGGLVGAATLDGASSAGPTFTLVGPAIPF